ncbi:Receptor expression-enhancing protein 1 [Eufriesea mexicana]|uniref:Receptor expression-enhancing protein 1 n=1 Tax=Eufriesea mexicana TaxID=516756 RepID=A0A310S750_9HYME|nr:Receptor expression-enhancing protein 1 [Eufriesea mexicana]
MTDGKQNSNDALECWAELGAFSRRFAYDPELERHASLMRRIGPTVIEKCSEKAFASSRESRQIKGERSLRSGMDVKRKEPQPNNLEENQFLWMICKASIPRILVTSLLAFGRYCADHMPKKMTLGCLRILAALLVIVMPRTLTYVLLYPIFRLVFGNLYPAYASYKAVRTKNVKEYVKWMMYWIVFALFTCAETFTDVFFSFWFPFYYEMKAILVIWLLSPTTKGSSILYRRFVHPALIRRESEIDEALERATEQGYKAILHLGSKGVNYATTVFMQTAIKHLLKSHHVIGTELPAIQSASAVSSLVKPPTTSMLTMEETTEQVDSVAKQCHSYPSTSSEELMPVESIPSLHTDWNTDDELVEINQVREQEEVFKVPSPKKPHKTRKSRKERSGKNCRRLRSRIDKFSDDEAEKNGKLVFQGGGGLVQHLKKSYSLSDLTGEKQDENRNTPHMHDETDMEVEPRRREHVGRRGYSPRRTQSGNTRVEMYFSEVDVDVRQSRSREPTTSLTNVRSSDDISSGYSSGEALQSSRASQGDSLVRTSSVGARTRAKPRSTMKKTPEDSGEDSDSIDPPSSKNISFPTPLNLVTPEQALEILLLLSQNSNVADYIKFDRGSFVAGNDSLKNTSQSGPDLEETKPGGTVDNSSDSVLAAKVHIVQSIEAEAGPERSLTVGKANNDAETGNANKDAQLLRAETQKERTEDTSAKNIAPTETFANDESTSEKSIGGSTRTITDDLCQNKFDELKQLLSDAHKAVNNIVYSQEKWRHSDACIMETLSQKDLQRSTSIQETKESGNGEKDRGVSEDAKIFAEVSKETKVEVSDTVNTAGESESGMSLDVWTTPNLSRSNSDSLGRAGKYNKKPAPKVPLANSEEDLNETDAQSALKATLIIKTGTLKTFSNTDTTKDVFIAHATDVKSKGKKSRRQRTKEGFSKLLTIPKNIFHNAFYKENKGSTKADDSSPDISAPETRSNSIEPQETIIELAPKLSCSSQEINAQNDERNENDSSNSSGSYVLALNDEKETGNDMEKIETEKNMETNNKDGKVATTSLESQIREMSQSPKIGKRLESDIF